jgi:hypothetical protein
MKAKHDVIDQKQTEERDALKATVTKRNNFMRLSKMS